MVDPSPTLRKLIGNYEVLAEAGKSRPLSAEENAAFEKLHDDILAASSAAKSQERRTPRARLGLQVHFKDASDAAHAFTRDVGLGGMSIVTSRPLRKGTLLQLSLDVAGEGAPIAAVGEVVWVSPNAMGVAFREMASADARRLKNMVVANLSFIERLREALKTRGPSVEARLSLKLPIVLALSDDSLSAEVARAFGDRGLVVANVASKAVHPAALVADLSCVAAAADQHPFIPLILVNATQADGVVARLKGMRPACVIGPPATAGAVLDALEHLASR